MAEPPFLTARRDGKRSCVGICLMEIGLIVQLHTPPQSLSLGFREGLMRRGLTSLNALINFFPVYRNLLRRIAPNSDLLATNTQYGDRNVITNYDAFICSAGEY